MIKLPKQFKHWCQKTGLKPRHKGFHISSWFYLQGHGREWRINCYGELQCGDKYKDFDRWALCDIYETEMPNNLADFKDAVKNLLKMHNEGNLND